MVMRRLPKYCATHQERDTQEVQVMYAHSFVENKFLRETVTTFALEFLPEDLTVMTIEAERAFSESGENICVPTTKFLLCTALGSLYKSKKLYNWVVQIAVPLPTFLTKEVDLEGETMVG